MAFGSFSGEEEFKAGKERLSQVLRIKAKLQPYCGEKLRFKKAQIFPVCRKLRVCFYIVSTNRTQ